MIDMLRVVELLKSIKRKLIKDKQKEVLDLIEWEIEIREKEIARFEELQKRKTNDSKPKIS